MSVASFLNPAPSPVSLSAKVSNPYGTTLPSGKVPIALMLNPAEGETEKSTAGTAGYANADTMLPATEARSELEERAQNKDGPTSAQAGSLRLTDSEKHLADQSDRPPALHDSTTSVGRTGRAVVEVDPLIAEDRWTYSKLVGRSFGKSLSHVFDPKPLLYSMGISDSDIDGIMKSDKRAQLRVATLAAHGGRLLRQGFEREQLVSVVKAASIGSLEVLDNEWRTFDLAGFSRSQVLVVARHPGGALKLQLLADYQSEFLRLGVSPLEQICATLPKNLPIANLQKWASVRTKGIRPSLSKDERIACLQAEPCITLPPLVDGCAGELVFEKLHYFSRLGDVSVFDIFDPAPAFERMGLSKATLGELADGFGGPLGVVCFAIWGEHLVDSGVPLSAIIDVVKMQDNAYALVALALYMPTLLAADLTVDLLVDLMKHYRSGSKLALLVQRDPALIRRYITPRLHAESATVFVCRDEEFTKWLKRNMP
jgi:hypothetical protein